MKAEVVSIGTKLLLREITDTNASFIASQLPLLGVNLKAIVGDLLATKGLSLATMESGTGGFLANVITNLPGSSAYFRGGFVAYSEEAKRAFDINGQLLSQLFFTDKAAGSLRRPL